MLLDAVDSPIDVLWMNRSAENKHVGNITIMAWQIEEKRDQRTLPVARLPDTISGRVSFLDFRRIPTADTKCQTPVTCETVARVVCVCVCASCMCDSSIPVCHRPCFRWMRA